MLDSQKSETQTNLLEVKNLTKIFRQTNNLWSKPSTRAVDNVSFALLRGETLGLVGESGCGKSTLARCILRLLPITSGQIIFDGQNITKAKTNQLTPIRRRMQIVFQEPVGSLNPRLKIAAMLTEPLFVHHLVRNELEAQRRVDQLLDQVGLESSTKERYPHEFSGGERQRLAIARALCVRPELIIADEPVSALDVSIQAQIVNLLLDLKQALSLTYLFISHDLALVEHISDRIAVMYRGQIVELGTTDKIFASPKHPYTQLLLGTPKNSVLLKQEISPFGLAPNETANTETCTFVSSCPNATELCRQAPQPLNRIDGEHFVACPLKK